MGVRTAVAFAVSGVAVLAVGAALRALARRWRWQWPRRSGGVALVVVVPIGLVAAPAVSARALSVVAGALALAAFGFVRDRYRVPPAVVPVVMVAVAAAVTTSGLRFPLGGVPVVDVGWTVLWLALVTTAVAGSGNADGQLPSLTAASAVGMVFLAGFARQPATTLFGALLGGLVAFLAYNLRPASLHMGRAGGLFAGFLIAAGALWVDPSIANPDALVVTVLLVGVALLDAVVVVASRLRHRRRVTVRVRDHLAHRLVAAGLRPSRAITLLATIQLVLSSVAVFVGRGVLSLAVGSLVAAVLLVALAAASMRARMSDEPPGFPGWVWAAGLALVGFTVLAAIPAVAAAFASRTDMVTARDKATLAVQAARDGDSQRATALFAGAEAGFAAAHDRLGSVATVPSLVVPVLGSNVHATRELSRLGVELSQAGRDLAEAVRSDDLRFVDGRVPLERVAAAAPRFDQAAKSLQAGEDDLAGLSTAFLVGPIRDGIREVRDDLERTSRDAARASASARIAPTVLGQGQPRRYLLLVQNPAELRGTGGLIGNWGFLTATDGRLRLETLERVQSLNTLGTPRDRVLRAPQDYVDRYERFDPVRTLQNANISPDFPTVSSVVADVLGQSGARVDGVLAVDPLGLAALMELTGPVKVAGWPTPINADNVVDVTLRDAYAAFARTPDRADFLGDVARESIDRATSGDLGSLAALSRTLGEAARQGHIQLWLAQPGEQAVVDEIGLSGRVPSPRGDSLLVSNTNAGGNKLDYYLRRAIDYSVTVTPSADRRTARAEGTIGVRLDNTVPASGVPQIAAGPYEGLTERFVYGQNHSYTSVYTPLLMTAVRADGRPGGVEGDEELGRNVYSAYMDAFAQKGVDLSVDVAGTVKLRKGWYELTLIRQPTLRPDTVTVRIAAPDGYEVLEARGLEVVDGVATGVVDLDQTRGLRVRIAPKGGGTLLERLESGV
ncbi:MAG: DUF4012 domain-containing protein [Actinomycetota bacterium]